jgi:hypothetical protein
MPYSIVIDGVPHNAIKLLDTPKAGQRLSEMDKAILAYVRDTGAFNDAGQPVSFFDPYSPESRDFQYFLTGAEVAKKVHLMDFGGENPVAGEFGVRRIRINDVMGGTAAGRVAASCDRAWGACAAAAATVFGEEPWTAGRREWLGDGSQSGAGGEFVQNEATFDDSGLVKTMEVNSAGNEQWVAVIVGIKSFAAQPVVEAVLAEYVGTKLPDWDVGSLLREGYGHAVKRAEPYIFSPEYGFKLGFLIEVAAPDQVEPLGWSYPTYARMRQATMTNCRVAAA